jgi:DNA polymerase III subunit beta
MKLRVERDVLAEAVGWAARALPARPVVPILAGLLLEASDAGAGLTLSCFDYEVSARVSVSADVAEPGALLVPGRLLADIARSLPDRPVELAGDAAAGALDLTCGSAQFTLLTLPAGDYPALPRQPPPAGVLDGGDLAAAVAQVAPAAGRDDTLPMLTGVFTEIDGETITLAATDRYRLAVRELSWRPAAPGFRASALVPARTLADAAKTMTRGTEVAVALAGERDTGGEPSSSGGPGGGRSGGTLGGTSGGDAPRGSGEGMIGFEGGGRRLTTRLLGAEFVPYRSRFPREFTARASVQPGRFAEAVRRVSLVADRHSRLLLTFSGDHVVIEAGSGDNARAVETAEARFDGEDGFAIGLNPQFLVDGVTAAGTPDAEAVTLEFTTADKPAVISGDAGFRYLIAPMRG